MRAEWLLLDTNQAVRTIAKIGGVFQRQLLIVRFPNPERCYPF